MPLHSLPMARDGVFETSSSDLDSGKSSEKELPIAKKGTVSLKDQSKLSTTTDATHQPPLEKQPTKHNPNPTACQPSIAPLPPPSLDPTNWPLHRKITLTTLCCLITFLTGWNATALTACPSLTNPHFHISDTTFPHSVWAVTAWNLGAALAPMVVLPIMEENGTRPGYLSVYALFVVFVVPQGVTGSYAVFCGVRFLAGCCAGVLQTCMDGVIADVWRDGVSMSRPVSCYVGALLAGVSSGPVFGALVTGAWGLRWEWAVWVQVIIYGVMAVPVCVLFMETRYPVIMEKVARREKGGFEEAPGDTQTASSKLGTVLDFLQTNILRPFHLLLTEPVVFSFTLLSALSYGITFISTQSIPQVYRMTYAFTEPQTGYIQAAVVLGELVGWGICMCIQDPFYARCAGKAVEDAELRRILPEKRLYAAIPASFLALAAGLLVYGFASYTTISIYLPTFGLFLVGIGVVVVMQAIMMYVTDAYSKFAASASAAVCFGENMFAAFLPLGSQGMYTALGFGWASGLLGFVAVVLGLAPVVLVWKGSWVREKSRFMREAVY